MADDSVIEIDLNEWKKLKVAELRKKIVELGLESKGNKAELIARLEKYINDQAEADLLEDEDGVGDEEEEFEEEEEEEQVLDDNTEENEVKDQSNDNGTEDVNTEPVNKDSNKISGPGGGQIPVINDRGTSQTDKLKSRQERFGKSDSDTVKKQARAERFGLTLTDYQGLGKRQGGGPVTVSTEEVEKLKKRAGRFGSTTGSTILNQIADTEKKGKRLERFGLPAEELAIKNRKERFATS